jgi:hypothetical protein
MTAMLLARARAAGLTLRVEDGRLAVSERKPSEDLLADLRAGRDDLIRALRSEADGASPPPPAPGPPPSPPVVPVPPPPPPVAIDAGPGRSHTRGPATSPELAEPEAAPPAAGRLV